MRGGSLSQRQGPGPVPEPSGDRHAGLAPYAGEAPATPAGTVAGLG